MKTKHKKFDIGKLLMNGAAAYQAYQFGRALAVLDSAGWIIQGVSVGGLILGAIVNIMVALAATRLPTVAKARKTWAVVAFIGLMALSPALVMPALHLAIRPDVGESWRWFLSFGYALAPDAAIALGGFIAGQSLVQLGSAGEKPLSGKSESQKSRSAKTSKKKATVHCRYEGAGCKRTGLQNAMNAHARSCPFKPTISMPKEAKSEVSK